MIRTTEEPGRTARWVRIMSVAFPILLAQRPCRARGVQRSVGVHEVYAEIVDPYYCAGGIYFSLTREPMPELTTGSEAEIYGRLLSRAWRPRFFLIEAGLYPMQIAGAALRRYAPSAYRRSRVGDVNMVAVVTESINFPEPWSVSVFIGNAVKFARDGESVAGRGNVGLLASYGNYHLHDNLPLRDHWSEVELKLKVDRDAEQRTYATSYRVGGRIHLHPDIKDLVYVGITRDRTDLDETKISLATNSALELRGDWSVRPAQFVRLAALAGKKFPFKTRKRTIALGLSLGVFWERRDLYRGGLARDNTRGNISPIIRPLVCF